MTQDDGKSKRNCLVLVGGIAGAVAIVGLLVAALQLWQSLAESNTQGQSQSTLVAISEHQLAAQQTLIALQQNSSSPQQIEDMRATIAALEGERLLAQAALTPSVAFQTNTTETTTVVAPTVGTETSAFASQELLLDDPFNDGNSDGWIPSIGSWSVVDGYYLCVGRHYAETTYGEGLWTDYGVSADVRPFSGDVDVSVVGRWQNPENYYHAQFLKGKANLTRRENGGWYGLASAPYAAKNGAWYNIKIEFHGTSIKMYVDNTLVLSAEDGIFLKGKVGLRCASNSQAYFDNVRVTP